MLDKKLQEKIANNLNSFNLFTLFKNVNFNLMDYKKPIFLMEKSQLKYINNANSVVVKQADKNLLEGLKMKSINELTIIDCNITDDMLELYKDIKKITLFMCEKITDNGMKHLNNKERVILDNIQITDKGLSELSNVGTVQLIGVDDITDEGLCYLNCKNLYLEECYSITDNKLNELKTLESLKIKDCIKVTDKCIDYFPGMIKNEDSDEDIVYLFKMKK